MPQGQFEYALNFGPHHPSTHGLLRLLLSLFGEEVTSCEPEIGYLHRGVEKLVESRDFISIIPYVDRLDYLAPVIQEHAYVRAIEQALRLEVPARALVIRTIFDELTRISSHIMAIGCLTYDLGCLSLFLYGFEEREKIMEIFRRTTGARMHLSYYIPGGVRADIDEAIVAMIDEFLGKLDGYLRKVKRLALDSRIFQRRTKGIGIISRNMAMHSGISGVNLRASGVRYDVRKSSPYGVYELLDFEQVTLTDGDCYARNELRYLEIQQSMRLIQQCLSMLEPGDVKVPNSTSGEAISMPDDVVIYSAAETPRGEFGVHMFATKGGTKPYRLHFKSPSLASIQMLRQLLIGVKILDIPAILGSLDSVMGCCDR
ncbi:MAG: NADH-quinone oxidoreductase subunit D [Alphaproteobacteria bacterium]|nr:NADH-quinone oxidoreductase subunit D [Alphaproteobacteria bacterium]